MFARVVYMNESKHKRKINLELGLGNNYKQKKENEVITLKRERKKKDTTCRIHLFMCFFRSHLCICSNLPIKTRTTFSPTNLMTEIYESRFETNLKLQKFK